MMKRLANSFAARVSMAGAIASAMLFACPAFAQDSRLSLADRVAQLEQQAQNKDQSGIGMVNQMQQLQAQVQQLQGQIEQLQHQLQALDDKNKAQYGDLDSRLGRLEGGGAGAGAAAATGAAAASGNASSVPADNTLAASSSTAASSAADQPASSRSTTVAASAAPAEVQAAYDVAFKSMRSGNYVQASREFRSFTQEYPNQALTPNAWYWLGESYYVTTNYSVALTSFQQLLRDFPQSEKAPDALLKVGYSQVELKQYDAAKATLTEVTHKYPGSKVASLAQERLQRLQQSSN
jgi:tol-pal system protein YbgF